MVLLAALALPAALVAQQNAAGQWRVEFVTPLGHVGVILASGALQRRWLASAS